MGTRQAVQSRMKPEFLFNESSHALLVILLCKNFLKLWSLITCYSDASDESQISTINTLACDYHWNNRIWVLVPCLPMNRLHLGFNPWQAVLQPHLLWTKTANASTVPLSHRQQWLPGKLFLKSSTGLNFFQPIILVSVNLFSLLRR